MDYQQWDERRKFKRYISEMPVRYSQLGTQDAETGDGNVLNISRGGVFIRTSKPLPVGTELHMKIKIVTPFGDEQVVESEATVAWVSGRSGEEGMGLNFTKIDRHSQYAMLACAYRGHD